jgi:hypothetical protein
MAMPTIEAMMTPTMTMRAEIRRNLVLLNWSSISFLKIVKIPCTSDLLKVFHVDLFEGIPFLIDAQFIFRQFLDGAHRHQTSLDHNPYAIGYFLNLLKQMG